MSNEARGRLGWLRRGTNVSIAAAILLGLAITAFIYGVVGFLLRDLPWINVYAYLYERGSIPFFETVAFGIAIAFLLLKVERIAHESSAIANIDKAVFAAEGSLSTLGADSAQRFLERLERLPNAQRKSMVAGRLENACRRLLNTHSTSEVDDVIRTLSDLDGNLMESSYSVVRFLSAVIPILGFLGTVYGIGVGLSQFTGVLENAQDFEAVRPALQVASVNLALAFDTTLVALFYSGVILLLNTPIQKREEDLLVAVDQYCIDRLVSRIHIISDDVAELKNTIVTVASELTESMRESSRDAATKVSNAVGDAVRELTNVLEHQSKALVPRLQPLEHLNQVRDSIQTLSEIVEANGEAVLNKLDAAASAQDEPLKAFRALVASLEGITSKMHALEHVGDSFKLVGGMAQMFSDLQLSLQALQPAIESMSSETAKEVNAVLSKLLRVMVVAYKLHKPDEHERAILKNPGLIEGIFGADGAAAAV